MMNSHEGNFNPNIFREEQEPFPHYPILLTGGGQGTGAVLAQKFALEGYQVVLGTRSQEKFNTVRQEIMSQGGKEPIPFIADITKKDEVEEAYCSLGLSPGEPVHYLPLAAGGLEPLRRPMVSILEDVRREYKAGQVDPETLNDARLKMKDMVNSPNAMELAMRTNFIAPLQLFDLLQQNGHLNSQSKILTLSSSFSDETNPQNLKSYGENGPWFYLPIGYSKKMGVQALTKLVDNTEASYIDLVAPEIEETAVGNFFETILGYIHSAHPENTIVVPKVSRLIVANAAFEELTRNDPYVSKIRTAYVTVDGVSPVKPDSWDQGRLPYL